MPFDHVNFIKAVHTFDHAGAGIAPMFRRRFMVETPVHSAVLHICCLGYGYTWLNGKAVTEDLFTAPVSDYRKTLWYTSYDVTDRLAEGENILAVICGNGWYNENLKTGWDYNLAPWRDDPKFIAELIVNGQRCVTTDDRWTATLDSPVIYNQLRSGEHFDARKYDPAWVRADYEEIGWKPVCFDTTPPTGVFRPCLCEPIREDRLYPAIAMTDRGDGRVIFDFGQNISGYVRLTVDQAAGDEILLRHAEELTAAGELEFNGMNGPHFYRDCAFQTDRLLCPEGSFTYSPRFTYHGFRYVEVSGLKNPTLSSVTGVFVHQAVAVRASFDCSDAAVTELFRQGQMATLSNLFYMPTDCPTREKLGWCNDAQASAEQMLTDFATEKLLRKWLQDIWDAMLPGGQLPGIVPTAGWGYSWGNGPVSEGILYEIPYRLYRHTGDPEPLITSLPYFAKNLASIEARADENGNIDYGLDDWAHPNGQEKVHAPYINSVYLIKFYRIAALACRLAGVDDRKYIAKEAAQMAAHKAKYLAPDGTCVLDAQTAVAMLIYHGIYDDLAPLKTQLARLVEEKDFHHDCGMVGLRHLYEALNACDLPEYAFRILTAEGFPSYRHWLRDGSTTLYEMWDKTASKNHHMYSDFMSWMMKTIVGITLTSPRYDTVTIAPHFFEGLTWAKGHIDTPHGRIAVEWTREPNGVRAEITIPQGVTAVFREKTLTQGSYTYRNL